MPDARPLSAFRSDFNDDPAASSEVSTPRTRSHRLRRALRDTTDLAREQMERRRWLNEDTRASRRRRRSESPHSSAVDMHLEYPEVSGTMSRRHKRLRRESPARVLPIKYGYYGQVEPGRLKLEVVSCDGGQHLDPRHEKDFLAPENLLRHDKSVYCSERPFCNILLRHADGTAFCMEKLHIVGPENGFDAPVREGMIFVGMESGKILPFVETSVPSEPGNENESRGAERTRRGPVPVPSFEEQLSILEALQDPQIDAALEGRDQSYAGATDSLHDFTGDNSHIPAWNPVRSNDSDTRCILMPSLAGEDEALASDVAVHGPIATVSEEDVGPEDISTQEVIDFRLQRQRLMQRRHEYDTWDRVDRWSGSRPPPPLPPLSHFRFPRSPAESSRDRDAASATLSRVDSHIGRVRVRDAPSSDSGTLPATALESFGADHAESSRYTANARSSSKDAKTPAKTVSDAMKDPDVTFVRFQMKDEKYRVALEFNPPVSGRFILLKLWANRSNVDVQSVVAKGYGGCRFFPAMDVR